MFTEEAQRFTEDKMSFNYQESSVVILQNGF